MGLSDNKSSENTLCFYSDEEQLSILYTELPTQKTLLVFQEQ